MAITIGQQLGSYDIGFIQSVGTPRNYDVTPDGKQFLVVLPASQGNSTQRAGVQLNVVLNWCTELEQRVPVK